MTHSSLSRVLTHIRNADWHADLIAVTGDLIQDDTAEAYEQFKKLMLPFDVPISCVPGNHDVRKRMRDALVPSAQYYYCSSLQLGSWMIVGIDSCVSGEAGGRVADAELDRLAGLLSDTEAANVLVCLHHPPLGVGSRWLDQVGLQNGAAFLDVIRQPGNVRGVIFGHIHQAFDQTVDSIRILGTPSTCRQFRIGSDEFALDDNPPAYRRLVLKTDGSIDDELVWVSGTGIDGP